MDDSFIGEIRPITYTFVPQGWLLCNGQSVFINNYQALYAILGATYGGDGKTYFNLPNLINSVAVGAGQLVNTSLHKLGATGGAASVALTITTMPAHTHAFNGAKGGGKLRTISAAGNNSYLTNFAYKPAATDANFTGASGYLPGTSTATSVYLNPGSISLIGGSQPHENRQPFTNLCFCICYDGIYPSPA